MKVHKPKTYLRMVKRGLFGKQVLWEPKVWKTMRRIQGDVFVDIGANEGIYTLALQKHFKAIYAYEPNPEYYEKLKARTGKNPRIHVFPYAISEKDGKGVLYLDNNPNRCTGSADTILPVFEYAPASQPSTFKKTYLGEKSIPVETRTLDHTFHGPLDLVKIDVEGAEFLVLQGASHLLNLGAIQHLIVELHNRYRAADLLSLFKHYDYNTRWLDLDHLHAWVEE